MLGRGNIRGKLIVNAHRAYSQKRAGARSCVWSDGNPDITDPGGLMYKRKSSKHDVSNRYLMENIVVTSSTNSRSVAMGRGYVTPLYVISILYYCIIILFLCTDFISACITIIKNSCIFLSRDKPQHEASSHNPLQVNLHYSYQ